MGKKPRDFSKEQIGQLKPLYIDESKPRGAGKNIYCVAADDNHNHEKPGSPMWDSCGGYVMIRAEKLEYKKITDALLKGDCHIRLSLRESWRVSD